MFPLLEALLEVMNMTEFNHNLKGEFGFDIIRCRDPIDLQLKKKM